MPTEFQVNIDAILESSRYIGTIGSRLGTIEDEMRKITKLALIDVFEDAVRYANSDDGFPPEFQDHVMSVIRNFEDFYIITDSYGCFISVDFEALGTEQDLQRAYHQGALLEDGTRLWGPYTGQTLKQGDAELRHIFWEAFQEGRKTAEIGGKRVPTDRGGHDWEETKEQYINIWGADKCPEWLFIQHGQEQWNPTIPSYDIIGEFELRLYSFAEQLLVTFVEAEIRIAEAYESVGSTVGFTKKGQPRLISGSFVNPATGRTIRPGQFAPRL